MKAFEDCHVDYTFYVHRERPLDEILPWDFIYAGVTKEFLKREYQRAREGVVTPNCRQGCSGCGWRVYEGGGFVNKGVYRPWPICLMNSLHTIDIFCPVCSQAIRKQIDFLCR